MATQVGTTTAPGVFLAPYVPSPETVVDRMLEIAQVGPGDTVYDLGAGDGRVVVAAAQRFGARAVGVELDDQRFALASARVRDLGLGPRAQIVHADLLGVDLRPATVVTLYQLPSVNEMLRPTLERQLRQGARVVTHDFPISAWNPSRVVTGRLADGSEHAIYLYTVSAIKKESATMAIERSYASLNGSLELQGLSAGSLTSSEGGDATADVVTEKLGSDGIVRKHIAGVKYTDLGLSFGMGMSSDLFDWIGATLRRDYLRKNGAVVLVDYDFTERARISFFDGLITEITFPACDANSKDAARITLKISPEHTTTTMNSGQKASSSKGTKVTKFLPSNFRLQIDGLDCSRVNMIDALTVRTRLGDPAIGELRDYLQEPANLEIPNLAITFAENQKDGFRDWFNDFVIKGNNGTGGERNGTLEYLGANKDVLFTLTFGHLGIFSLTQEKVSPGNDSVRRVRAEMYCEELTFQYATSASTGKSGSSGTGAGDASGAGTSGSGSKYSDSSLVTPAYALPYVPSVTDKIQVAMGPQNLAPVTTPRLGRPLKFRS